MNVELGDRGSATRRRLDDLRARPGEVVAKVRSGRERLLANWAGYNATQRVSSLALSAAVIAGLSVLIVGGGGADAGDLVVARDSSGRPVTTAVADESTVATAPVGTPADPTVAAPAPADAGLAPSVLGIAETNEAPARERPTTTQKGKDKGKAKDKKKGPGLDLRAFITNATARAVVPVGGTPPPPVTAAPTTRPPATTRPTTTERPVTTRPPTTPAPTTAAPTTAPPTTAPPTTAPPTTAPPTTAPPTTAPPTTAPPTTAPPTTAAPTTAPPTTAAPTTTDPPGLDDLLAGIFG